MYARKQRLLLCVLCAADHPSLSEHTQPATTSGNYLPFLSTSRSFLGSTRCHRSSSLQILGRPVGMFTAKSHHTIPNNQNKYSQKRNCAASAQFPHSCACNRFLFLGIHKWDFRCSVITFVDFGIRIFLLSKFSVFSVNYIRRVHQ